MSHNMPRRILIIRPCCIGDVVLATPTLLALRRAFPEAHLSFAVGGWSRRAIEHHPALDSILDTGPAALPVKSAGGFWRFVRQVRAGQYDMVVSLVRSPLMSLAVLLSGVRVRVGLDSNGRGFGYTVRVPVDPAQARHEAEIYLDTARALKLDVSGCRAQIPVLEAARQQMREKLAAAQVESPYVVIHPAGGSNPGMVLHSKRWLPRNFAAVADHLAETLKVRVILLAGPDDGPVLSAVAAQMQHTPVIFSGTLTFPEIGALAADARLYLGNDTGLTHLAAASGAKTVMILGPSDPVRYAPFTDDSLALWKPATIRPGGVAAVDEADWNPDRDAISVPEVLVAIEDFLDGV